MKRTNGLQHRHVSMNGVSRKTVSKSYGPVGQPPGGQGQMMKTPAGYRPNGSPGHVDVSPGSRGGGPGSKLVHAPVTTRKG